VSTPIYQTSTFEVTDLEEQVRATPTDHFYTRYGNPTHTVAENAIAELEGTDAALLFASGMSAISTTVMALVKSGDHIVAQRDIYGGATKFFTQWLPKFGVEATLVDTTDYDQHAAAIRPNTKILYLESPTNPTLRVVDLKRVAVLAKKHSLISLIDSTFATPINCRPAEFGIDLVMHSGTKFFGGHADLIAGIVAGRRDLIEAIHATRTTLGCNMDPHAAWLLLRGLKTLAVRVQRQNENALQVAQFLKAHPKVRSVSYPFLDGHPQQALAMEQMRGGGGVLSFEVEGTGEDACRFAEALQLFTLAPSLGGVESLVTIPVITSHAMIRAEERQKMGVTEQMVRLSMGIEHVEDLIADLERGFAAVRGGVKHTVGVG
jgi:cystathionine beta-lyase/cystathionine gamma-synthase